MPCAGLEGVEYIDTIVSEHYAGFYSRLLRDFIENVANIWCLTWVRQNYSVRNQFTPAASGEKATVATLACDANADTPKNKSKPPHITEPGEPQDEDDDTKAETSLDPWSSQYREKWQQHSEMGPNLNPKGATTATKPWIPNINPVDFDWCNRWLDVDVDALRAELLKRKDVELDYERPDLSKDMLNDDYQRLFVELLLQHADEVLTNLGSSTPVPPLRLLLLGTAGTGKTTSTQTALQELRRKLTAAGYPLEFFRVAAYTGCAAFNVRFNATTIHRLIKWFNPRFFQALTNPDRLAELQAREAEKKRQKSRKRSAASRAGLRRE